MDKIKKTYLILLNLLKRLAISFKAIIRVASRLFVKKSTIFIVSKRIALNH